MNGNSSLPRASFFAVGLYDETFQAYGCVDLEMGYRLRKAGVECVYKPKAMGDHSFLKMFPAYCCGHVIEGEALVRIYRAHPEIKVDRKLDIIEDSIRSLPPRRKGARLIWLTKGTFSWLLIPLCILIHVCGRG